MRSGENEKKTDMPHPQILDTRFRSALARLAKNDRIMTFERPADPHLEIAAVLKKHCLLYTSDAADE